MFAFSMKNFMSGMVARGWSLDELDVHIGVDVETQGSTVLVVERDVVEGPPQVVQLQYKSEDNTVQVWWDFGSEIEDETPKFVEDVIAVVNPDTV
jgi:hypothetical protein